MIEVWKKVKGYEDYLISNFGNVKSIKFGKEKLLKDRPKKGYKQIVLYSEDKIPKYFLIHRLVALHFIENKNNHKIINHKDCNKSNNYFYNLEWCSNKENTNHALKNNLIPKGENHKLFKIKDIEIKEIRFLYKNKIYNQCELAKIYNTAQNYISKIVNNKIRIQ
jgi:hypothetical protein